MEDREKLDAYVGFDVTSDQRAEIKRRARADGRSMASWIRSRLDTLFKIDATIKSSGRVSVLEEHKNKPL